MRIVFQSLEAAIVLAMFCMVVSRCIPEGTIEEELLKEPRWSRADRDASTWEKTWIYATQINAAPGETAREFLFTGGGDAVDCLYDAETGKVTVKATGEVVEDGFVWSLKENSKYLRKSGDFFYINGRLLSKSEFSVEVTSVPRLTPNSGRLFFGNRFQKTEGYVEFGRF